jgi:DNA repair protein RecO (recombination protein O)
VESKLPGQSLRERTAGGGASVQTTALVLRTRPLGEADVLVSLLCQDGRRLELVARSGRASRRRFAGCLEPFSEVSIVAGRHRTAGLPALEEASLIEGHLAVRQDLQRLGQAAYAMELVECFALEEEANPALWPIAAGALSAIEKKAFGEPELAYLELRVLQAAGLAPVLEGCLGCGRGHSSSWRIDASGEGFFCSSCAAAPAAGTISAAALDFLRALGKRRLPPAGTACSQARRALQFFLSQHAGRAFRALEFLREIKR